MGDADPNKLAFEQTTKGLDRQAEVLDQLRTRTGIVLSATGIIASLLGSQALQGSYSLLLVIVALAATASGILLCIRVLWPVQDTTGVELPQLNEGLPHWNRWPRKASRRREWQVTVPRTTVRSLRAGSTVGVEALATLERARHTNS
jgi:hypothetical protein